MSALDQAFIKAYRQTNRPTEACAPPGVPLSAAIVDDSATADPPPRPETVLAALASPSSTPPAVAPFQPTLYKGPVAEDDAPADAAGRDGQRQAVSVGPSRPRPRRMARRDLRRLLQGPPTLASDDLAAIIPLYQPGDEPPVEPSDDETSRAEPPKTQQLERVAGRDEPSRAESPSPANSPSATARGTAPQSSQSRAGDRGSPETPPRAPATDSAAAPMEPCEASILPVRPPALPQAFRPLLEVDHFAWPEICRRLDAVAAPALDRRADALLDFAARGRRVVAFGAARRGEGATTVLSAVASRLASRRARVALVDGDLGEPQLARRLGLLPQAGWDDVLAGHSTLAEVTIQSAEDGAILLPIREPFGGAGVALGHREMLRDSIRQLATDAELVLVALGPLEDRVVVEQFLAGCLAEAIDGTVLVRSVRAGQPARHQQVVQSIRAAGVEPLGIVENLATA